MVERARLTVPPKARSAPSWSASIKAGADARYELSAHGRVRLLSGDTLKRAIDAAIEAGEERVAERLPILLPPGTWETNTRLTLPDLVTDRLFGIGQIEESVLVWGTPEAIEIWSNEFWLRTVGETFEAGSKFVG